jgi:hypothetical protein
MFVKNLFSTHSELITTECIEAGKSHKLKNKAEAGPKYRSMSKITLGHIRKKSIASVRGWGELAWQNINWKFEKFFSN